jgi:hypothetical protein
MMTSVVLIGLIYFICVMYLDDCTVHAVGDDQFLERLAQFNKHLITLKPSKCKFGMSMVEYCGKQIDRSVPPRMNGIAGDRDPPRKRGGGEEGRNDHEAPLH